MKVVIPDRLVEAFIKAWNESPDTNRSVSRYTINMGWCYQFAMVMKKVYGRKCELWQDDDGAHCWVKIGKYFYDSDHTHGTLDPPEMGAEGFRVTIKTCLEFWARRGYSGPVRMDVVKKAVAIYKEAT